MHTEMWEHPATRRQRGAPCGVAAPWSSSRRPDGSPAGHRAGPAARARRDHRAGAAAARPRPTPCRVTWRAGGCVVSAGGTREPLDPVRFLGQPSRRASRGTRSPGVAAQRGATVTLVAAHTAGLTDPAARGRRARQLGAQLRRRGAPSREGADAVVMAAAVADFRPGGLRRQQDQEGADEAGPARVDPQPTTSSSELVRHEPTGRCPSSVRSSDSPPRPATTHGDVLDHARAKLARKGCDLLVVNAVGDGRAFEVDTTTAGCWRGRHRGRAGARFQDADGEPGSRREAVAVAGAGLTSGMSNTRTDVTGDSAASKWPDWTCREFVQLQASFD